MPRILLTIAALMAVLLSAPSYAASPERGSVTGGIVHEWPPWFKESFLEIGEDAAEAAEADKHLLLFFSLNDCPYCTRMLDESFTADPNMRLVQTHFDSIGINVRGDRDVVFNEDIEVTEKQLAEILGVFATPAILFLDENNRTVARVDGYRAPERFRQVLAYVSGKAYRDSTLADFMRQKLDRDVYQPRANPLFSQLDDLSAVDGPLMIILEDGSCYDCDEFYDGVLADAGVREELAPYTIVRLDAASTEALIDVDGSQTTAASLAQKHVMIYRPGVLVFDRGELVHRTDSLIYPHHFKEGLRFISTGAYRSEDYETWSTRRTEELLEAGVDIYLGPPKKP